MNSRHAWLALAVGVIGWEIHVTRRGEPLLSEVVDDWLIEHPILTRFVIFALAAHLANLLDPRVDIVSQNFFLWRIVALRSRAMVGNRR